MSKSKPKPYTPNKTTVDAGIPCPHCGARFGHHVKNTYPNGNRRRICGLCAMPFVSIQARNVIESIT